MKYDENKIRKKNVNKCFSCKMKTIIKKKKINVTSKSFGSVDHAHQPCLCHL